MRLVNFISGSIITTFGATILYIIYYIISLFYKVSLWISIILNAPEEFATLITIISILFYFGIILSLLILAFLIILFGICLMFDEI